MSSFEPAAGAQDQSPWRQAAAPFLVSRIVLFVFAWWGMSLDSTVNSEWRAFPSVPALDGWARWDSGWYASVAIEGYSYLPGQACNANFFPLYPALAGLVGKPLGLLLPATQAFHLGGMLVSLAAFWIALAGLWRLVEPQWGEVVARRTLWLVALFPFSLFFSAVYTESVFLGLSVWAFVLARRQRWLAACILASLAAVTRTVGFLVAVSLAADYLQRHGRKWDRSAWTFLWTPVPLLALLVWFYARFDEPVPFLRTYTTVWDKRPGVSRLVDLLYSIRNDVVPALRFQNAVYLLAVSGALALVLVRARQLGAGMTTYAVASLLLVASTGFNGSGRYVCVLFPAFIAAALKLTPRQFSLAVAAQVPLLLWFTWDFNHALHVT